MLHLVAGVLVEIVQVADEEAHISAKDCIDVFPANLRAIAFGRGSLNASDFPLEVELSLEDLLIDIKCLLVDRSELRRQALGQTLGQLFFIWHERVWILQDRALKPL